MAIYKIADLNIKIEPVCERVEKRLTRFLSDSSEYDFEASVTHEELEDYIRHSKFCADYAAEDAMVLTKICRKVLADYDGFFFHSSSLLLDGEAYVFSAPSGTGKSTHTSLWRELFGEKVTMINDDKPIIRRVDGKFKIFSTPWMGKSNIGNNISAPVKAVYILRQAKENKAQRVEVGEVFRDILEATLLPGNREGIETLLSLLDGFFSTVKLFRLDCNMDIEAAKTAFEAANQGETI